VISLSRAGNGVPQRTTTTTTTRTTTTRGSEGWKERGASEATWIVALFYEVREEEQPHPVFLVKGRLLFFLTLSLSLSCFLFHLRLPTKRDGEISAPDRHYGCRLRKISRRPERIAAKSYAGCQRKFFFLVIVQKKRFSWKLANLYCCFITSIVSYKTNNNSTNKFNLSYSV